MPEISQEELDDLRAKAALAPEPGAEPAAKADPNAAKPGMGDETPPEPDKVAVLVDGSKYEFAGAIPSHVAVGDKLLAVVNVYPL